MRPPVVIVRRVRRNLRITNKLASNKLDPLVHGLLVIRIFRHPLLQMDTVGSSYNLYYVE
jgi:hypothetical protein